MKEIYGDVREACIQLKERFDDVEFYREPFQAGGGHIAVVKVPGDTVIVHTVVGVSKSGSHNDVRREGHTSFLARY